MITRGNKKLHIDWVCSRHVMKIAVLIQWIMFGGVLMDFCNLLQCFILDMNKLDDKSAKAIAKSLKINDSIHSINLGKLYLIFYRS